MTRNILSVVIGAIILATLLWSCEHLEPASPNSDEILDGPIDGLTYAERIQHLRGDKAFFDQIFTPETGLGPVFVATSCGSCHAGDGKGHPFTSLIRFGQTDSSGNSFLERGGPQLQNRAIPGYVPEQIPAGATYAKFMPPGNTGLGFLELVPDSEIIALSDPNDINGDNISGVLNWINIPQYVNIRLNAITQNGKYIGRFGKKASVYNLMQQTANAYNQDIGVTSIFAPVDVYSLQEGDPEVSTNIINDVVFYLQTLKAPIQRNQNDDEVIEGKNIFGNIKCTSCHTPQLQTSYSPIKALSQKTFSPYTDLLLHDMGPSLDDGYTEGSAKTSEWRTAPLWGLGLSPNSQGGQYFLLHDGRAHSIEEAILMHGGEATTSGDNYKQLFQEEKRKLIKFLESL